MKQQTSKTPARANSTTRKRGRTIRQRAQAIVDNPKRYDSETREAIFNVMVKKAPDLKECVIRAERGETILDITAPPESEFSALAREENISRRGFPLDYDREAAQLAAYMESDETPQSVKHLIIDYMNELSTITRTGLWTPAILRVAYPIMRYRDGASEGARMLLGVAIDAVTDEAGRARLREIWIAERERLDASETQMATLKLQE